MRPFALALLLAGCAGGFSDRERLVDAVRDFNNGVRWGRGDVAGTRMVPEEVKRFADREAALADEVEFADYDVTQIDFDQSHEKATVRVEVAWSAKRRGLLERTTVAQSWERRRGEWLLAKQTRVKGARLPLYDEPSR